MNTCPPAPRPLQAARHGAVRPFVRPLVLLLGLAAGIMAFMTGGVDAADAGPRRTADNFSLRAAAPDRLVLSTAVSSQQAARDNATYNRLLNAHFGSVTPDTAFKWGMIHPTRTGWVWGEADREVARAESNRQLVRGHTLLWDGALPEQVRSEATTCEAARTILREHVTALVSRYRGRIWQWDVANELFDENGRPRDTNPFLNLCGLPIVDDAFRWARAADPAAKLYLNEYGTLETGAKSEAQYALVRGMVQRGVPIDGVGFQAHERTWDGLPASAGAQLGRYANLGLDVMVTEADVRMRVPATVPELDAALAKQAAMYRELLSLCLEQQRCVGFTVWGFTDRWSWVEASLPGQGNACLMDGSFVARPAWHALRSTLLAAKHGSRYRAAQG